MATKLKLLTGHKLFVGNVLCELLADVEVNFPNVDGPDALAEHLAAAGQKTFGDYVAALAHDETVTRRDGDTGRDYRVQLHVTYVAGGARHEDEISAREVIEVAPLPPPPPAPAPVAATEGTSSSAELGDSLAAKIARGEAPDRRAEFPKDRRGSFPGGKLDPRSDTSIERRFGPAERRSPTEVAALPAAPTETATLANPEPQKGPGGIERREVVRRLSKIGPPAGGERRHSERRAEDRASQPPPQA